MHDPAKRQPDYLVKILGFGRRLLPVQAHSVYWSFQKLNGVEGAIFLGLVMGLGKTTIFLAIHHIQHRINYIQQHVDDHLASHLSSLNQKERFAPVFKGLKTKLC
jgi:hypothetical protein